MNPWPFFFQPEAQNLREIFSSIERPLHILRNTIVYDLLWSDPIRTTTNSPMGWQQSERTRCTLKFGHDVANAFFNKFHLNAIFRGHETSMIGYEPHNHGTIWTIFSAPNYCNALQNRGAVFTFKPSSDEVSCPKVDIFKPSGIDYKIPFYEVADYKSRRRSAPQTSLFKWQFMIFQYAIILLSDIFISVSISVPNWACVYLPTILQFFGEFPLLGAIYLKLILISRLYIITWAILRQNLMHVLLNWSTDQINCRLACLSVEAYPPPYQLHLSSFLCWKCHYFYFYAITFPQENVFLRWILS